MLKRRIPSSVLKYQLEGIGNKGPEALRRQYVLPEDELEKPEKGQASEGDPGWLTLIFCNGGFIGKQIIKV